MSFEYVIYIDEAGDDGLGKLRGAGNESGQSRWFVVGAIVVRRANDAKLVSWRDEILDGLPNRQRRDIHFKSLKHDQRRFACQVLSQKKVGVAVAMSNKATLLDVRPNLLEKFKQKNHLHNYLTRWLIERVSKCIKATHKGDGPCRAKIVFSRRGGMSYDEFREYMMLIRDGKEIKYSPGRIDWDVIDPDRIEALDHVSRAGLQLADIATSAFFKAVEPNNFGMFERSYADLLRPRILKMPGKSPYDCGITHVPRIDGRSPLSDEQRLFFESWR